MTLDKNKWIEEVLGSADHISRTKAPDMTERILSRAGEKQFSVNVPSSQIWSIAASVMLLIALNVGTLYIYSAHRGAAQTKPADVSSIFGLSSGMNSHSDMGTEIFGN
jgi:hypothetical protein